MIRRYWNGQGGHRAAGRFGVVVGGDERAAQDAKVLDVVGHPVLVPADLDRYVAGILAGKWETALCHYRARPVRAATMEQMKARGAMNA